MGRERDGLFAEALGAAVLEERAHGTGTVEHEIDRRPLSVQAGLLERGTRRLVRVDEARRLGLDLREGVRRLARLLGGGSGDQGGGRGGSATATGSGSGAGSTTGSGSGTTSATGSGSGTTSGSGSAAAFTGSGSGSTTGFGFAGSGVDWAWAGTVGVLGSSRFVWAGTLRSGVDERGLSKAAATRSSAFSASDLSAFSAFSGFARFSGSVFVVFVVDFSAVTFSAAGDGSLAGAGTVAEAAVVAVVVVVGVVGSG